MNFQQLQSRSASLAELEGYTDANNPPRWDVLVNRAWVEFSWDAEIVVAAVTLTATIGQALCTLPTINNGPFKEILDVIWDYGNTNGPVGRSTEAFERNMNPSWLSAASGVPVRWAVGTYDVIALSPPPNAAATVWVRGVCQGLPMTAATDLPGLQGGVGMPIPEALHEAIAYRAAWLQNIGYAQGDAMTARLSQYDERYKAAVASCRVSMNKGYRRHTEEEG